eukprot:1375795-Prymnesium_polylepis.1
MGFKIGQQATLLFTLLGCALPTATSIELPRQARTHVRGKLTTAVESRRPRRRRPATFRIRPMDRSSGRPRGRTPAALRSSSAPPHILPTNVPPSACTHVVML